MLVLETEKAQLKDKTEISRDFLLPIFPFLALPSESSASSLFAESIIYTSERQFETSGIVKPLPPPGSGVTNSTTTLSALSDRKCAEAFWVVLEFSVQVAKLLHNSALSPSFLFSYGHLRSEFHLHSLLFHCSSASALGDLTPSVVVAAFIALVLLLVTPFRTWALFRLAKMHLWKGEG